LLAYNIMTKNIIPLILMFTDWWGGPPDILFNGKGKGKGRVRNRMGREKGGETRRRRGKEGNGMGEMEERYMEGERGKIIGDKRRGDAWRKGCSHSVEG
jgi:hypothetical protein